MSRMYRMLTDISNIDFMSRMYRMLTDISNIYHLCDGFIWQQVPCYLSECIAFKCYFCHVFVMCSFNTWMKLSTE